MPTLRTGTCRAGFTLLELVVVIFILSLVMGLAMPSFYSIGEESLKSEAKKMASILRYLNDDAIARKDTFPLKINLDAKTVNWDNGEGKKSQRFDHISSVSSTSKGNVSDGEVTLLFGPLGLQENLVVALKDSGREMSVSFNPLSGRVKIIQNSR